MPGVFRRSFVDFLHLEHDSCLCCKHCLLYRWNNSQFSRPLYVLKIIKIALKIILLCHHAALFSGSCCRNNRPFHILASSHKRNKRNTKLYIPDILLFFSLLFHGNVCFDFTRNELGTIYGHNLSSLASYNSDKAAINVHLGNIMGNCRSEHSFFIF